MRFFKGDRVEVLTKRDVPSGSWRYGIILSGNGHTYYIRSESATGSSDTTGVPIVERVPRKAIRPCPPLKSIESWAAGDFVEVFDNSSWKFATVLKVTEFNLFLVKLLGTSQKVKANKSNLRLPQSWQDGEWIVIQKVSADQPSTRRYLNKSLDKDLKMRHVRDDCSPVESESGLQIPRMVSSKILKRGSPGNLSRGTNQKLRAMEKEGRLQRRDTMSFYAKDLEANHAERSACSVGSSGTSNKEEMVDGTHKLALDAYYRTMEALRVSGFISWEQEEMITNLRLKLNISNDEHLMELRKLVSAQ
ncbi:hypothetical protein IFM89_006334 [Coptis chinensis]|uniref:ENT domain-containing protein n=1 Tax=Coptis chinensis TaxID=261450 RepID=A0A835IB03_9MAGN|nr:hypothetical protein IFM89_006334 [Coptis chinensis]